MRSGITTIPDESIQFGASYASAPFADPDGPESARLNEGIDLRRAYLELGSDFGYTEREGVWVSMGVVHDAHNCFYVQVVRPDAETGTSRTKSKEGRGSLASPLGLQIGVLHAFFDQPSG